MSGHKTVAARIQKLEGYTKHLSGNFIRLKTKYSLTAPLLFDKKITAAYGKGYSAHALGTMRHMLYYDCVREIAVIAFDKSKRAPSLTVLAKALNSREVILVLEREYSVCVSAFENSLDADFRAAMKKHERAEEIQRRKKFRQILKRAKLRWKQFSSSDLAKSLRTIRDKFLAHWELRLTEKGYDTITPKDVPFTWGSVKKAMLQIAPLVEDLDSLIRRSSFDWKSLDRMNRRNARAFWKR